MPEGGVTGVVEGRAFADDDRDMRQAQRGMEEGARRVLDALHRPFPAHIAERGMICGMPVTKGYDGYAPLARVRDTVVQDRDEFLAVRHRRGAALEAIPLHLEQQHRIALLELSACRWCCSFALA